jgi:mutator protein MutT
MSKKIKSVSAGVVITDGQQLLLGHVTNGRHWDLPKGRVDPGESALQAAVRELREETGLVVEQHQLIQLGIYDYKPKKDLHLFLWPQTVMPDPSTLTCESMFDGPWGRQPELDQFVVVDWLQLDDFCAQSMLRVLRILERRAKELVENA